MTQHSALSTQHSLAGQVAIVTGAGRGIGRSIAFELAAAGAAVAATARTATEIAETAAEVERAGGRAIAVPADVTDPAAIARVLEETERRLGPVDLLVNNAAAGSVPGPAWEVDPDAWWRGIEVNLRGPFLFCRAVLPAMVARRRGRIINVASLQATRPYPYGSGYGAGKAGLLRFTDSLAIETTPHNVQVFAISPGMVLTPMSRASLASEAGRKWFPDLVNFPADQWLPPERAGRLCAYLASGKLDRLSGRFIHVLDDWDDLARRAEEIVRDDLHTLRLRK
jgi:NAD(P)-dependent dehydrogenase (short-subunit alcohol dehydrogenase family)